MGSGVCKNFKQIPAFLRTVPLYDTHECKYDCEYETSILEKRRDGIGERRPKSGIPHGSMGGSVSDDGQSPVPGDPGFREHGSGSESLA